MRAQTYSRKRTRRAPSETPNRLREFRVAKGMTQEDLAAYLGVKQGTIATAEIHGRGLGKRNWYRLADLFGVDPRALEDRTFFCAEV